jgi:hypothetical protein
MTERIAERDICWAPLVLGESEKVRTCIVIGVIDDIATVVYGQGRPGDCGSILVKLDSDLGKRARLTKDTHFREGNVTMVKLSQIQKKVGVCPRGKFLDFQDLAERFFKKTNPQTGQ